MALGGIFFLQKHVPKSKEMQQDRIDSTQWNLIELRILPSKLFTSYCETKLSQRSHSLFVAKKVANHKFNLQ